MESAQQELQLRDYLRIFRKRRRLILSILGGVLATVAAYSFIAPRIYQSQATLQVQGQSGFVIRAAQTMEDSTGSLTPTALTELIAKMPYRELSSSLLTLTQGYDIDLTALRNEDDIVSLFESDLLKKGLPQYFGRLALRASNNRSVINEKIGLPDALPDDSRNASEERLEQRLSSGDKEETIKQAGALAALSRRFGVDLFAMSADQIEPQALKIMDSSLVRALKTNPLHGKRWEDLSPLERGAAVEAAYREVAKKHPDDEDKREAKEDYSTHEIKDTGMLEIAFNSPDPNRSMLGADAMSDVIVWKNQALRKEDAQVYRQVARNVLYGANDKGGLSAILNQTDKKIRNFKKEKSIPNLQASQEIALKELTEYQDNYNAAVAAEIEARKQVDSLNDKLASLPLSASSQTMSDNPQVTKLQTDIADATSDLKAAQALYQDENPKVLTLKEKIASLEADMRKEAEKKPISHSTSVAKNPFYASVESDLLKAQSQLSAAEIQKNTYLSLLNQLKAKMASMPDSEYQLTGDMRDQLALATSRGEIQGRYIEAIINEETKTSNAKIIELALEPGKKIRPRRTLNLVFGLMLGLFMGLAAAVVAETLDRGFNSREELERAIPDLPTLAILPAFAADDPLVSYRSPRSSEAEAFRSLRSAIRFLGQDRPLKTIAITSPGFGDGKSLIAANLATAMAQSGQKVILVDADLRKPVQHLIFKTANQSGLSTTLAGETDLKRALQPTEIDGLSILPCGPVPSNPAELLDSAAMSRLTETLAESADIVLFDSPPVGSFVDASLLGSLTEGTLLVVGAGQTSLEALTRAKETLTQARSRLIGLVLNRVMPIDGTPSA